MSSPRRSPTRRVTAAGGVLALSAALTVPSVVGAVAASAAEPVVGTGSAGQTLTVEKATDLDPAGETITVRGAGFPTFKGSYVAVCKTPPKGEKPTPCGGGADMEGASQTSQWISSNAPSYAKGLTVPYTPDGGFEVQIFAAPTLPDGTDCRDVGCSVIARADHTRASDRSLDVLVPVTFASGSSDEGAPVGVIAAGAAAAVALLGAIAAVFVRRRRPADPDPGDGA